jgi:hypothetical protein
MTLRTATLLLLLLCVLACALIAWLVIRDVAQPRIVAAQPPLALALIPGRGGAWAYVEGDGAVVTCAGCVLGPAQVNGAVRTYTVRPFWPGWQITATRGAEVATVTQGSVLRFPVVGRDQ